MSKRSNESFCRCDRMTPRLSHCILLQRDSFILIVSFWRTFKNDCVKKKVWRRQTKDFSNKMRALLSLILYFLWKESLRFIRDRSLFLLFFVPIFSGRKKFSLFITVKRFNRCSVNWQRTWDLEFHQTMNGDKHWLQPKKKKWNIIDLWLNWAKCSMLNA